MIQISTQGSFWHFKGTFIIYRSSSNSSSLDTCPSSHAFIRYSTVSIRLLTPPYRISLISHPKGLFFKNINFQSFFRTFVHFFLVFFFYFLIIPFPFFYFFSFF